MNAQKIIFKCTFCEKKLRLPLTENKLKATCPNCRYNLHFYFVRVEEQLFDYYDILGVTPDATTDTISSSYRKLAVQHHPDKNVGNSYSPEVMKFLNDAKDVLTDPEIRQSYDQYRIQSKPNPSTNGSSTSNQAQTNSNTESPPPPPEKNQSQNPPQPSHFSSNQKFEEYRKQLKRFLNFCWERSTYIFFVAIGISVAIYQSNGKPEPKIAFPLNKSYPNLAAPNTPITKSTSGYPTLTDQMTEKITPPPLDSTTIINVYVSRQKFYSEEDVSSMLAWHADIIGPNKSGYNIKGAASLQEAHTKYHSSSDQSSRTYWQKQYYIALTNSWLSLDAFEKRNISQKMQR